MCALGSVPTVWCLAMRIIWLSAGFTSCCALPWDSVILTFLRCRMVLMWPGRGILFSPNFDSWGQWRVLTQSITLSKQLSQEYSLYAPPFSSNSLCDSTVLITGIPKSRTRKEVIFNIFLVTQYRRIILINYWVNAFICWWLHRVRPCYCNSNKHIFKPSACDLSVRTRTAGHEVLGKREETKSECWCLISLQAENTVWKHYAASCGFFLKPFKHK